MEQSNGAKSLSSEELLKAQTHAWNHMFGFINSMSLKCALQLDIPDIIHNHGKPMTLSELVASLPIHPSKSPCVYRLMRLLVHLGFFVKTKIVGHDNNENQEGYFLTQPGQLLLKDNPCSARPIILMVNDPILFDPWHHLATWLQGDNDQLTPSPFNVAHNKALWEYAGHEPRLNHLFNDAMGGDSMMVGKIVSSEYNEFFEGFESMVDVAGGTGNMAKAIAQRFPKMECIVLDLPQVVADLQGTQNLKFVGGDMFESIPPAHLILLKWVLHDWSDEECVKILRNCKKALNQEGANDEGKEGKVIIIDVVTEIGNLDEDEKKVQLLYDMEMMVIVHGKERNEKEWAKLFIDAGFSNYKINPILGPRALIELYHT